MSIIEGIIYGVIQGVTEFLPISSSGHLALLQNFFGAVDMESNYFTFTVLLHLGTLAAVIAVFREDVWEMIKGFFTFIIKVCRGRLSEGLTYGERIFILVFVATLPLFIAVPFADTLGNFSSVSWLIGLMLLINGGLLYVSDKLTNERLTVKKARPGHALIVGFMQLIGSIPGISRSGSTIIGSLFLGFKKQDAVKLSFLMSIPAIAGANILKLFELSENPLPDGSVPAVIAGVAAAVLSGLFAIRLLEYVAKNRKMSVFSLYCVIIGTSAIISDIII